MKYDCIVVGGGVVGTAVLDRLARYSLSVMLLEKQDDVAFFATRANSGYRARGYDCEPNTQKARFNVEGNALLWQDAQELNVPHLKCGSIVVATKEQTQGLEKLAEKARANGVEVEILSSEKTREIEPMVADEVECSLYAPSAGVVSPYQLCIAYVDRAVLNGAQVRARNRSAFYKKDRRRIYRPHKQRRFRVRAHSQLRGRARRGYKRYGGCGALRNDLSSRRLLRA